MTGWSGGESISSGQNYFRFLLLTPPDTVDITIPCDANNAKRT